MLYGYKDISIGDTIKIKNGGSGIVQKIESVALLNHMANQNIYNKHIGEVLPFKNNTKRNNNIWYGPITVSCCNENGEMYLAGIDFKDIETIIKPQYETGFISKIKRLFSIH